MILDGRELMRGITSHLRLSLGSPQLVFVSVKKEIGVVELCGAPGTGKTQVTAAACCAHVLRHPSRTALCIASTAGDVELRIRQLVLDTLVQQWHLYTEGGSVSAALLPQFLHTFPACAYKCARALQTDQPEITAQLEQQADTLQDDKPPLWLAAHIASCIVAGGIESLTYEVDCCMRQIGVARVWSAADATQILEELKDKLRSPDHCAEVLDPRCAFHFEDKGVGLFYARRPLPGDVYACDERLGLLAMDGIQHWVAAGWPQQGTDMSLMHHRRVAHLGFLLQHISTAYSVPVLVTNSVRRPRELFAAYSGLQGLGAPVGMGAGQPEEDGDTEGQVEASLVGKLASLPADELMRRFYAPSLGVVWSSIACVRILLLSFPDIAGVPLPLVTARVGEELQGQGGAAATLSAAAGLPSSVYGCPVSYASVGVQEVSEVACRDPTARAAVALKGPAGTPTHVGIIFSVPSEALTVMPASDRPDSYDVDGAPGSEQVKGGQGQGVSALELQTVDML